MSEENVSTGKMCPALYKFLGKSVLSDRIYMLPQDQMSACNVNHCTTCTLPEITMYGVYQPSIHYFNKSRKSAKAVILTRLHGISSIHTPDMGSDKNWTGLCIGLWNELWTWWVSIQKYELMQSPWCLCMILIMFTYIMWLLQVIAQRWIQDGVLGKCPPLLLKLDRRLKLKSSLAWPVRYFCTGTLLFSV